MTVGQLSVSFIIRCRLQSSISCSTLSRALWDFTSNTKKSSLKIFYKILLPWSPRIFLEVVMYQQMSLPLIAYLWSNFKGCPIAKKINYSSTCISKKYCGKNHNFDRPSAACQIPEFTQDENKSFVSWNLFKQSVKCQQCKCIPVCQSSKSYFQIDKADWLRMA